MGVIARYREFLPVGPSTPEVDLHEGSTPLVPSRNIGRALGLSRLFFKYEGLNPTGSFKDRGMVVAVAKALEAGSRVLMCASTGNTSASMAAYAARMGVRAIVVVPSGEIAMNKLSQALMYGAKVVALKGTFDTALEAVRDLTSRYPVALMNSINPDRIQGQKTAAFEVVDVLGDAPDYLLLPVGNAGNITAYWKGFREYHAAGRSTRLPRMVGAQADGAAPIVAGHPIANPRTVASAIRIGNPASWEGATSARDESGGLIAAVTDTEILAAQIRLANTEGLFAEPASAAPLALLFRLVMEGKIEKDSTTVVVLTGSGLKDPDAALKNVEPPIELDGDARTLAKVLKL
ncbi:MAG: threonine synthase [Actinobacteria bacterium 13_1_20CM_2_65_11]|nr:MAG: threonine synthase [Chloroflexi bacterium 13_1_40CM_65_17]OLC66202.1 MAG: threonine synthase [Actinobacteria bacterium 13_1_40CM_4_65_12]OLD26228.1 MAG: threonine synthase [Chloroflexi bacterium 13_1_40CM_3_65_12]OLD48678.1 MAG: threonine synthase [Actinobacteria bacterium 13_1_40CM_2_65_8]OLE78052.1 MAG: threonine synthase [Actinobacteria bacterium 13_1_20CM_2_65_11]